jgi:hypothetical protein
MTSSELAAAKTQAKALRRSLEAQGKPTTHSEALELIAQQYGARDWNTLCARLNQRNAPVELTIGHRVAGTYLGQAFTGEIMAVSGAPGHRHLEIKLDEPVDTVQFDSFSNWRSYIRGTVDSDGRSHRKTSDGKPQLCVEQIIN